MTGRRRRDRIDYGIDDGSDLFTGLTWPDVFLRDPAYSLLRPLYDRMSPWRSSHDQLCLYLSSQARRLGGRRVLLFHFSHLHLLAKNYLRFQHFLLNPFDSYSLDELFLEIDQFLHWRFDQFSDDPWKDYPIEEKLAAASETKKVSEKDLSIPVLSDQERRKLLKRELSKIPWQTQLQRSLEYETGIEGFHSAVIEKAIKECPELLAQKSNEDLVSQIFSSEKKSLSLTIGSDGYLVTECPVMLGSHYLSSKTQKVWFDGRNRQFFKILGCYAKWLDAKLVVFKDSVHSDPEKQKHIFDSIKEKHKLIGIGNINRMQADGIDYYLSLLIDSDIPSRSFIVSEWQVNLPITIVTEKDI